MSVVLVPHTAIPELAARVTSGMLKMLRHIQKADFILNGEDVDRDAAEMLRQLTELGLIDPGYDGEISDPPSMWVLNGNSSSSFCPLLAARFAQLRSPLT